MNHFCVLIGLDVVGHGLNLYVHVLSFGKTWNLALRMISCTCGMAVLVVMACDENLGRNSDGI